MAGHPIFLVGAGFNADAKKQTGPIYGESIYIGRHEIQCGYPLVGELARLCFGLSAPPTDKSIEDLFQESLGARNLAPVKRLLEEISQADYYIAEQLSRPSAANCYAAFFNRFAGSHFLTFNYDSLVELFLFRRERWFPHDGYGVPVEVRAMLGHEHLLERCSASQVIHLHGSSCVFASTFTFESAPGERIAWHKARAAPKYIFDPHSIGLLFSPFERGEMPLGYEHPEERVIAPVPEKAVGLNREFIASVYRRARELIVTSGGPLVAIGYSFNPLDRASYDPVLLGLARHTSAAVLLVSPEALSLRGRMAQEHRSISWSAEPRTFTDWVDAGFPGIS